MKTANKVSALQALNFLKEGNARFKNGNLANKDLSSEKRVGLADFGQQPFAVVICCSDSRVPPEVIFDQGLGDLFVVRLAGNVLDTAGMGSVEYGVEHLGISLVVVLGHENCGAVKACVDGGHATGNLEKLIEKIKPALEISKTEYCCSSGDNLYQKVEDANIKEVVLSLNENPVLNNLLGNGKGTIIGAKYLLKSGEAIFWE